MILHCNFEELRALQAGAELILDPFSTGSGGVAAPVQAVPQVAMLQPRLGQSLSVTTLEDQRLIRRAIDAICTVLHDRMDEKVLEYHPAHEEAVALYFEYAHAFGVLRRLDAMGAEMTDMIELMTGEPATADDARKVTFPD